MVARRVRVDQANQLEIAGYREGYGKLRTFEQKCARDAGGSVEDRGARGESRAAHGKGGLIWPSVRKVTVCGSSAVTVHVMESPA